MPATVRADYRSTEIDHRSCDALGWRSGPCRRRNGAGCSSSRERISNIASSGSGLGCCPARLPGTAGTDPCLVQGRQVTLLYADSRVSAAYTLVRCDRCAMPMATPGVCVGRPRCKVFVSLLGSPVVVLMITIAADKLHRLGSGDRGCDLAARKNIVPSLHPWPTVTVPGGLDNRHRVATNDLQWTLTPQPRASGQPRAHRKASRVHGTGWESVPASPFRPFISK